MLSTWTVASTRANTLITRSRRKSNSNKKWLAENRRKFCVSVQTRCIVGITGTVHTFVQTFSLLIYFEFHVSWQQELIDVLKVMKSP